MSWFANNLYAKRSQALEEALCSEFPGSVYRINDFKSHSWWKPEIVHGVPEGGLLAVRPFSDGDTRQYLHQWYDETVLNWDKYADFGVTNHPLRIPPEILGDGDAMPPAGFLRYLRHISKTQETPLVYYQSFTWGGSTEEEFAFVYHGDDEFLYFMAGLAGESPHLEIRHNSTEHRNDSGDVLVHALRHIGLELPSPYFAPHTRPFEWSNYLVDRQARTAKQIHVKRSSWATRIISNLRACLRCGKK